MLRECVALSIAVSSSACSFVLDFDQAPPADASIDGPYTQAECDFGEPNNSPGDASMLEPGATGPAAICAPAVPGDAEDRDFYKFAVTASPVTIAIQFTNRPGGDLDLKLYDSSGAMLAQSRSFGDGEMIVCPATSPACPMLAPGEYIFEVFPGVLGSVNSYTFSITQ